MNKQCLRTMVLEKTLESPLDGKEIKLVNPKGNQPWIVIGRTDAEAEALIPWPILSSDVKSWLIGKDPDAGKDWKQKERKAAANEMVGWYYQCNGHEFEQTPGDRKGQGILACCSSGGRKGRTRMSKRATTTKLNLSAHSKDYTPWAGGYSTWNARTIQYKKINTIHPINRRRQKSHHHLNWCRKSTWQNWTPFIIKTLSQTGREENYLNIAKVNKWKWEATVSVILNGERLKVFPLTPGIRQGHSLSPLLLNTVLEVQARAIRHEEEVKGIQSWRKESEIISLCRWHGFTCRKP